MHMWKNSRKKLSFIMFITSKYTVILLCLLDRMIHLMFKLKEHHTIIKRNHHHITALSCITTQWMDFYRWHIFFKLTALRQLYSELVCYLALWTGQQRSENHSWLIKVSDLYPSKFLATEGIQFINQWLVIIRPDKKNE